MVKKLQLTFCKLHCGGGGTCCLCSFLDRYPEYSGLTLFEIRNDNMYQPLCTTLNFAADDNFGNYII